jgi:dTDP-4-amino-4,6-dideoxygalactose transaminase
MEPYIELEEKYAEWSGKPFGIGVNSGTSALHLILVCLGVGPGDEVIVPDFAFASVAFAVTYCGAIPVFVDCGIDYNIVPELVDNAITEKTKAIIVVHTYGRKADVARIQELTDLPIIEDCCEAQGIELQEGTIGIYSFYRNKILPAEEGGMIVTHSSSLYKEAQLRKNMANENFSYYHPVLGFNYRLPNAEAKLALESWENREQIFKERREVEDMYLEAFGGERHDVPWVFDFIRGYDQGERDEFLKIKGVRPFFKPQSTFPIYNQPTTDNTKFASEHGFVVALDPKLDHKTIIKQIKQTIII